MPRRDFYHNVIRSAFENDGWVITADPYKVIWKEKTLLPDLAAERIIAAQRGVEKIAVEIKNFTGDFNIEFYEAIGQLDVYNFAIAEFEPERTLVLAISQMAWDEYFQLPYVISVVELKKITIVVVDTESKTISKWIK